MNEELYYFKIDSQELMAQRKMEEAIDTCRGRAMDGQTVSLYARKKRSHPWTLLGHYAPANPIRITDRYSGKIVLIPVCCAEPAPLKRFHF